MCLRVMKSRLAALGLGGVLLVIASAHVHAVSGELAQAQSEPAVTISETQAKAIKIDAAGERTFPQEQRAVGSIDFNQELLTQIFTPYQGRILKAFASVGETVAKGKTLFTIDSPDLLQAESTLIATAGVLELTTKALERQRNLFKQSAGPQKDYEQSVSDHQAAEAAHRAARGAVRVFGKTDAEIEKIAGERKIDSTLVVPSPITGLITARNAAPGLFVQPGNPPPVFIVADTSTMWMIANVPEKDAPALAGWPAGAGRGGVAPREALPRQDRDHRSERRSRRPPGVRPLRDREPGWRAEGRHVRELHHHGGAAETRARGAAG